MGFMGGDLTAELLHIRSIRSFSLYTVTIPYVVRVVKTLDLWGRKWWRKRQPDLSRAKL